MNHSWNSVALNEGIYEGLKNFMERKGNHTEPDTRSNCEILQNEDVMNSENNLEEVKERFISEYRDKFYTSCKPPESADRKEMFDQIFKNQGYGEELLMDHQGWYYNGNYVTTYDLMFNHLKKGICGPFARRYSRGTYTTPIDLMAIYPNLTNWKLHKEKEKILHRPPVPVSEYKSEYACTWELLSENRQKLQA